ncbi:hypothetical protein MD535_21955 [Vibrio sp. ZSDZ65]|uniref:Uncharacterized protein n=1 Tax=Vibrio qingdaonensis TaxID=2829491 RepID=A0A9X3CS73_9VIBR|nr:hypothetical protein [Vibrio qingdaonensis]MCW8348657.1 hypothetical protein [Vibrio qingdaonensis]
MRQKISVEQLKEPIFQDRIEDTLREAERAVDELTHLNARWLTFSKEKLILASESLNFLLKQRFRLFKKGFPSSEIDYLNNIDRQIGEIKKVYLSFYRLKPGFIHQLRADYVEIYVWLMLQPEFSDSKDNVLCGLALLDEMACEFAKYLVIQSPIESLDYSLVELIDGGCKLRDQYFELLTLRQSASISLTKRWLRSQIISEEIGYCALACMNAEEGIEWLNSNPHNNEYLFERLLTKHDRGTWFRQCYGIDAKVISNPRIITFAKLLELKEFIPFEVTSRLAPIHFVLSGDSILVPNVMAHVIHLDELDGEIWIKALYVVYGDTLPILPWQVSVEVEWQEALNRLNEWVGQDGHYRILPSRLGRELTFESTMSAMMNQAIDDEFRSWMWKQVCLHSRVYIPWDTMMPLHQQKWNISRLKTLPSVAERFKLRSGNAAVGY